MIQDKDKGDDFGIVRGGSRRIKASEYLRINGFHITENIYDMNYDVTDDFADMIFL